MKRFFVVIASLIAVSSQAYAGNGDLIVDGKIGVGTTNPTQQLEVIGSITVNGSTTIGPRKALSPTVFGYSPSYKVLMLGSSSADYLTQSVTISLGYDPSGNPSESFAGNGSEILMRNLTYFVQPTANNNGYFRTLAMNNGNVGIGTSNPNAKLDVGGNIALNGTVIHSSDLMFKKNLQPVDGPLGKVLSLNGLSYEWKTDEYKDKGFSEGRHYGVIAQEIEKVLPEVVSTAPDGTKAVAYTEIIPVLIEAIKEQQRRIDKLEKQLSGSR